MSRYCLLAVAILVTQITPAYAQDYEITPYIGWRTSSSLEEEGTGATINLDETGSYGFILSMKKSPDTNYDFLFSRQDTELKSSTTPGTAEPLRIDYYHLGGTIFYDADKLHPFISGGLGATHITPSNSYYSSETMFSLSVGGGLKFPLTPNIGLRLEARGYGTVVSGSGAILCSGGCVASFNGNLFMQLEALAGMSIAF